jgi:hypothetical protein
VGEDYGTQWWGMLPAPDSMDHRVHWHAIAWETVEHAANHKWMTSPYYGQRCFIAAMPPRSPAPAASSAQPAAGGPHHPAAAASGTSPQSVALRPSLRRFAPAERPRGLGRVRMARDWKIASCAGEGGSSREVRVGPSPSPPASRCPNLVPQMKLNETERCFN